MRALQNVNPTPEQLAILADTAPGFRLIRGAAGSGKTTTALLRLRQLCTARRVQQEREGVDQPIRVLALTFNRTLRGYITQLASEQIAATSGVDFTVDTFAHWAVQLTGSRGIVDQEEQVRPLLIRLGGRVSANLDYFIGEVNYITGRFTSQDLQNYLGVERSGRGRAPVVDRPMRERLLRDVIALYEAQKREKGLVDWNDVALAAAAVPSQRYDIVVADETQDFSSNQIRAIIAHLNDGHATTFIMDAAQRIYPQVFTPREVF